ncbi:DnaB-like helicase N-terminal domain-containing protein [Virgisporangium aurantiacum]|uniref:DnaB-like helicase N-terminal domain-containing protein n=1 Tax=Virgisporangium aurantiacum TaxID=175570 RepID=UPI003570D82D
MVCDRGVRAQPDSGAELPDGRRVSVALRPVADHGEDAARLAVQIPAALADREDALLGGLLQHPEQVDDVAAFLPAEAVTDPERRSSYKAILVLAETAESIDEVIVAWDSNANAPRPGRS